MRSVPAALIAVLLVAPLFLAALFTISVSTWVLDRDFYVSLIDDERLYEVRAVPDQRFWKDAARATGIAPLADPALARKIVTPQYMRSQALSVLDQAFDFANGSAETFDPVIDLSPLRKALTGMGGARAAAAARIPDSLRLSRMPGVDYAPATWWNRGGFTALGAMVLADVILLLVACGFWVAAAFIGGENTKDRLLWLGGSLLAPSAVVFLSGLATLVPLAGGWILRGIQSAGLGSLGYSPGFAQAVFQAARTAVGRASVGSLATGGIACGIAIAILVIAATMKQAEAPRQAQGGSA
jgi:hypothetical protein